MSGSSQVKEGWVWVFVLGVGFFRGELAFAGPELLKRGVKGDGGGKARARAGKRLDDSSRGTTGTSDGGWAEKNWRKSLNHAQSSNC